ncbi:MAG: rod shape-determining protein MreC [Bacteroidota bacterium]|jgi:rod shape-determining protein MreC
MERLLKFIYEYRAFLTFLFLELTCAWLIVENNQFQSSAYFNSSNRTAASVLGFSQGVREYFSLRTINRDLAEENAILRTTLEQRNQRIFADQIPELKDVSIANRFEYIGAKVVSNSTQLYKNYITVDKGKRDGIHPGMAAISSSGAVGKVKSVSDHFSVLISLLHTDEMVSCVIKQKDYFGTAQWDGADARFTNLRYIPRHANPAVGDSVVTSGYNAIFPNGVLVGVIRSASLNEESPFWIVKVELAQDFSKLSFVELVKSNLKNERDSLEITTMEAIR